MGRRGGEKCDRLRREPNPRHALLRERDPSTYRRPVGLLSDDAEATSTACMCLVLRQRMFTQPEFREEDTVCVCVLVVGVVCVSRRERK